MASAQQAVSALQKHIYSSTKIRIEKNVFRIFWESIARKDGYDLKSNAWIINTTLETVQFYVYNSSGLLQRIPAQIVDAQPSESVQVHGGIFEGSFMRRDDDLVVFKDNRGTSYTIKKNHLYLWIGSTMIQVNTPSTIECFRNQYDDPRRSSSGCCAII